MSTASARWCSVRDCGRSRSACCSYERARLPRALVDPRIRRFVSGVGEHLVVRHELLALEEIVIVLAVVAGALVVVARESLDGIQRIPHRRQQKFRHPILGAAKDPYTAIARRRRIIGEPGVQQIRVIGFALACRYTAMPGAG